MGRNTGAFFYGLMTAVIVTIILMFFVGSALRPIFYIGIFVFFTPFAMWCRLMELKRKDREKEEE